MIYLDTHIVVWAYFGNTDLLSEAAADAIRNNDLAISPMVILELQYLRETGRHTVAPETIIRVLAESIRLSVADEPFPSVISAALAVEWTRDPFDRLIVAQAALTGAPLVSRDRMIRANYPRTIW